MQLDLTRLCRFVQEMHGPVEPLDVTGSRATWPQEVEQIPYHSLQI